MKGLVFVSGLKKDMRESFVSRKGKGKARVKNYVEVDDEDDEDNEDNEDKGDKEDEGEDDEDDDEEDDEMDGKVVEHAVAPLAPPRELPFAVKRRPGAPAPSKVKRQNIKLRHTQTTLDERSDEEHQQSRSPSPTPVPRLQNKGKTKATSIQQEESPLDTDDVIVEDHLLAVASSDNAPQAGLAAFVDYDLEAPPSSGPPTPNPSADNPPAKPNWHNPLRSGKPL